MYHVQQEVVVIFHLAWALRADAKMEVMTKHDALERLPAVTSVVHFHTCSSTSAAAPVSQPV